MFAYEKSVVKKAASRVWRVISGAVKFVVAQITDPAVRRAMCLGAATMLVRKAPFLDQQTAEQLAGIFVLGALTLLSKLPGTSELKRAKAAAQIAAAAALPEEHGAPGA